jgi:hypothetical protein
LFGILFPYVKFCDEVNFSINFGIDRISDEVIKKTNQQDFIGTVPNLGFRANSMLFGSAASRAYAQCDPRKRLEENLGKVAGGSNESGGAGSGSGMASDLSNSLASEKLHTTIGGIQTQGTGPSTPFPEPSALIPLFVPLAVRKVQSNRGKLKIKEFNYEVLNNTPFVGLENTAPNAYTNPILQVFFALPEVRECALAAQTATYHHNNATSLWCELGFLFHMMTTVESCSQNLAKPIQKVVTPSNFQRTFQQIPESVALGLLDNRETPPAVPSTTPGSAASTAVAAKTTTSGNSNLDTQQMSQVFCRFLFQQLHREADLAILARNRTMSPYGGTVSAIVAMPNTVDSVFGYSIATTTTFLQSGTIELGSANKAYSLEVVYPILGKNTNTRNVRPSPSAASSSATPPAVLLSMAISRENAKDKVVTAPSTSTSTTPHEENNTTDPNSEIVLAPSTTLESDTTVPPAAIIPSSADTILPTASEGDLNPLPLVIEAQLNVTEIAATSTIAASAPGAVPSFASVLWGSYQRETHMRGWCSASETYEPFKQVRSLLSLPKVLTLLCGDTVRDPRDATLSGALGEAQSYGSMHTNFWSQSVDLSHLRSPSSFTSSSETNLVRAVKASWLPVEIELAVYRSQSNSTGSVYFQGRERAGSGSQASRGQGANSKGGGGKGDKDKLVISGRLLATNDAGIGAEGDEVWTIFDGATEALANFSASRLPEYGIMESEAGAGQGWEVFRFSLFAVVSHVVTSAVPSPLASSSSASTGPTPAAVGPTGTSSSGVTAAVDGPKHSILHIRRKAKEADGYNNCNWWMFNDFVLNPSEETAVATFADWRHPSTLFFAREDYQVDSPSIESILASTSTADSTTVTPLSIRQIVPASVLLLPSLSQTPCVRLVNSTGQTQGGARERGSSQRDKEREKERERVDEQYQLPPLPDKGDLVAFDGEFVSVQAERVVLNAEGQKVVKEEGRMLLARISIISDKGCSSSSKGGKEGEEAYRLLVDDYILPSEPVIDYVTRFSGIVAEDLNPSQSRYAVVPYRTAYLKLRFFLDKGCVFVGHGLQKDFETANIFVPPEQVCTIFN